MVGCGFDGLGGWWFYSFLLFLSFPILAFLFVVSLVDDFEPDPQGLDLRPQLEEALMYLALEMHLYSFFGVIDGLDGAAGLADLGEDELPFVALPLRVGCRP